MSDFKWRHYQGDVILGCVRWYCKYGISYRELEEMMLERGVDVNHTTIYRWVQRYTPEIEKRLRYYWRPGMGYSWRVDETYVKVNGQWKYLYRAVDKRGVTVFPQRVTQKRQSGFWVRPYGDSKIGRFLQ